MRADLEQNGEQAAVKVGPPPLRLLSYSPMYICPQCRAQTEDEACPTDGTPTLALGDDPRCGRIVADRFVILDVLGRGGMGVVYRAWQTSTERVVALKLLRTEHASPDAIARFMQEARITANLSCPHTVTVHEFGKTDEGDLFMAMELIEGQTLEAALGRVSRMDPERALRVAQQICTALEEAHEQGLVHRDLKPANVMLQRISTDVEYARVLDFGVARLLAPSGAPITRTGSGPGTPAYMSPEQAKGEAVGPASDQYALGLLLFEMLTGRRPFAGNSTLKVLMQHAQEPPPALSDAHPAFGHAGALEKIMQRLLAKEPSDRYADIRAVRHALAALNVAKLKVTTPTDRSGEMPQKLSVALAETQDSDGQALALAPTADSVPQIVAQVAPAVVAPTPKRIKLDIRALGCSFQIALAIGALVLFSAVSMRTPPSESLPHFVIEGPMGGQKIFRSASSNDIGGPFLPFSQIQFTLRPPKTLEAPPGITVYAQSGEGPLRRVEGVVESFKGGAYRVTGEAQHFFGDKPGPHRIHLAIGAQSGGDGMLLLPACVILGGDWHVYDVDYRATSL